MTGQLYLLHGLQVRADMALHERPLPQGGPADVVVTTAPAAPAPPVGSPQLVAEHSVAGTVLYQLFRRRSGAHLLRVPTICDFEVDAGAGAVTCRPVPGVDPGWLPILVRGTLIAVLLELRGHPCLHASAVDAGGGVVAFVGSSGAGKTTTAAMLCAAGATLVADDVLVVDFDGAGATCRAGSPELRLRDGASSLLDAPGWISSTRRLADGRLAVRPRAVASDEATRLSAVVFPTPQRSPGRSTARRVRPSEAVFRLSAVRRVGGWNCAAALQRGFEHAARAAGEVPVFDVQVPWGPPWDPSATLAVLDEVAEALV